MRKTISSDQYAQDFKQVVLYNSVYAIHAYFESDPKKFIDVLKRYSEVKKNYAEKRIRIDGAEFHNLLQQIERINYAFSLPTGFIKSMFHKSDGKQPYSKTLDLLVSTKQLHRWSHGVLSTKTATKHFATKYLYQYSELERIFADDSLLDKALNFTSDFYTKRQYRFISKLKNLKQQKEQTMTHNENEPVFIRPFTKKQRRAARPKVAAPAEQPKQSVPDIDEANGFDSNCLNAIYEKALSLLENSKISSGQCRAFCEKVCYKKFEDRRRIKDGTPASTEQQAEYFQLLKMTLANIEQNLVSAMHYQDDPQWNVPCLSAEEKLGKAKQYLTEQANFIKRILKA